MSILDKLNRINWDEKPLTEFESSEVGISKIKSAIRIYENEGNERLDSVFWRVCDGLGDIVTYMIAHGYNGEQTHTTGKGYSLSLSDNQYGEAILENAMRKHGAEKTIVYSSLQARDE